MSNKKLDLTEVKKRISDIIGLDYEIIEYNPGKYEYSTIKHISCGKEYTIQNQLFYTKLPNGKNRGTCPFCNSLRYSKEDIQNIVNKYLDDSYEVINYINKRKPIKILHKKCGEVIELYLRNIYKSQRCQKCESGYYRISETNGYNLEKFKKSILNKYKNLFDIVGEYKDYNTKIKIHCNTCNNNFMATPNSFTQTGYCPFCNASAGEQLITKYLNLENIEFEFQKNVKINEHIYRFDFYIPSKNLFIEYDGKQHFQPVFGRNKAEKQKNFELTKIRDNEKNNYCREQNINLLRIPYQKLNHIYETLLENNIISPTTNQTGVES